MPPGKITIVGRGQSISRVVVFTERERPLLTFEELKTAAKILLAGKVTEEVFFGVENSTNYSLAETKELTSIIRNIVYSYRFNQKSKNKKHHSYLCFEEKDLSNDKKIELENKMEELEKKCQEEVRRFILDNKKAISVLAEKIYTHETLTDKEISETLDGQLKLKGSAVRA